MKKHLFFSLFFVTATLLLSCATNKSTNKPTQGTKKSSEETEEINKKITATTNIAKLVLSEDIESAYYRMDQNFRNQNTFADFEKQWNKFSEGLGKITDYTIDTSEYDSLNFYKNIKVLYKFEKGDLAARYLFNSSNLLPMEVSYGKNDVSITKEIIPLKDLCSDYFKLGCGITGANPQASAIRVPDFMDIVKEQFSSCTSTNLMKPSYILNQTMSIKNLQKGMNEPGLDFSSIDKTLSWCYENKVPLRGHTLVWHTQTPEWFFKKDYKSGGEYVSREEMIERLDSFIRQYLTYVQENYPGTVYCWDVVNEAVDPENGDSSTDFMCRIKNASEDSYWYQTIGPDYPEVAFTIARKYADENVKLIYNDYGAIGKRKSECIYNLCKSLKEKNLIDGIGIQGYWDIKNPSLKEIEDVINKYAELGLEIQITEWSIPAKSETEEGFREQAERYASVFKLLQKLDTQGGGNANITCVSFFGVQDRFVLNPSDTNNTRLYDTDFNPKPVFFSIQDVFKLYY